MICERCQKAQASVHIDEVKAFEGPGHPGNEVDEHHLCETCAEEANLPHLAVQQKTMDEVWKLLQKSAMKAHGKQVRPVIACKGCGTTLEELRRKGRLGCEGCYTTFGQYLGGLLERMHGSTQHIGRLPGIDADQAERAQAIEAAQSELEEAIQSEEFERAAELRDRLSELTDASASERCGDTASRSGSEAADGSSTESTAEAVDPTPKDGGTSAAS